MNNQGIHPTRWAGRMLAALLMLSLSACQLTDMARFVYANATATHHWKNTELTTTVPFTLIDNHIILPVRVNGSEPLNFVLDSGAAATVIIDSRATRDLQLEMQGELTVSGVGTGDDPVAHIVPQTDLTVGEVSLEGNSVIFLPLDSIPFFDDLDHVYFDGVIGAPFFTRFAVEIDYERCLVSFSEPAAARERIESLGADWREVPLEIDGSVPYMTVQVDPGQGFPVDVKLLVDTGARGAVSLTPSSDERLQTPPAYFQSVSDGLSGEVYSQVAMAESLSVAGYRLQRLPVSYAVAGGEDENDSNGILGNEVLQQFNLVFDYSNDRLFLLPNSNFATPIEADKSGLQLRPHTEGGIVKRIAPDSAGQASPLEVGDIITSFDDSRVSHENLRELKRALASGRDSVRLCWQSGAMDRCDDLTLASRF